MDFSFTQQGTLLNVPSCSQDRNLAHTALSTSKMSHFGARGRRCAIIWDGYTERKVSPRLSFQNTYIYVFIHTYVYSEMHMGNGLLLLKAHHISRILQCSVCSTWIFSFPFPPFSLPLPYLLGKNRDHISHRI